MTKRIWLDFVYLFCLQFVFAYIYFKAILNYLDVINISLAPYLGIVPMVIAAVLHIQLKLKKNNIGSFSFSIFLVFAIGVFYLFLSDYYNYNIFYNKGNWLFGLVFIAIIVAELNFHFLSYEKLKKNYDNNFGFLKMNKEQQKEQKENQHQDKEKHDEPHTK